METISRGGRSPWAPRRGVALGAVAVALVATAAQGRPRSPAVMSSAAAADAPTATLHLPLVMDAFVPGPPPTAAVPSPAPAPLRTTRLGFTPFPYDISEEAVRYTYEHLAVDGDIVAHHFDSGVPWPEALAERPYSPNLRADWADRRRRTPPGHKVYVAITPISIDRDGLAPYWGDTESMPLPAPWDGYTFDAPEVEAAFLNHARRVVDYFDPDYLAVGIEVNLLVTARPGEWAAYAALHRHVYRGLKASYPDLPVFVTLFGMSLLPGYRPEDDLRAHRQAMAEVMRESDLYALSLYPYLSTLLTAPVPPGLFEDLFALSAKPLAIAETGYPAETFSVRGGEISFPSTPVKQAAYIEQLLGAADRRRAVFVINFVLRDYDALWQRIGGGDLGALWRDTGLYDEAGGGRPSLDLWHAFLRRPVD